MKQPASLLRRIGAMLYDTLLVLALLFLATIPFLIIGEDDAVAPATLTYQLTLVGVIYVFLVGFWCKRGSTLGMLAWGLRVEQNDESVPTVTQGTIRFLVAAISLLPVGLGFWWQLWDKDKMTWHDRASKTRVMYYPKTK